MRGKLEHYEKSAGQALATLEALPKELADERVAPSEDLAMLKYLPYGDSGRHPGKREYLHHLRFLSERYLVVIRPPSKITEPQFATTLDAEHCLAAAR